VGLAYSLTVGLLELPTGGLSDVLGRRVVLIAAAVSSLAGLLLMGLATTAALFAASALLRGVARALGTGPAEAWFVDTVGRPDPKGLAHGSVALSSGLAVGTIAGGAIPLALSGIVATPLAVPVLIGAGVEVIRLIVVLALPEPRHSRPSLKEILWGVPAPVRDGVRLSTRDAMLARLMLITGILGVMLATIELLTPAWLVTATGRAETAGIAYAVVAALGFASSALGGSLSARIVRLAGGPARGAQVGIAVTTVALLTLAGATVLSGLSGVVAAGFAYCLMFVGLGIGNPALSTLTHERVPSSLRATVLSAQSLALMLAGAVGVVSLAALVGVTGPAVAFVIVAALVAGGGVLLRGRRLTAPLTEAAPPVVVN
jgi:MFS family permease